MNSMDVQAKRAAQVRIGIQVEVFTILWMVIEAIVSIGAGVLAHSALLVAFGIDSVIELVSGAILLWRLSVEARGEDTEQIERAEHRAAWVVAVSLALLCAYVLVTAAYGLITRSRPESSLAGIAISIAALIVMPVLGVTKRRIAARIDSAALRGDAASSFTCGYMAGAVLLGVGLNALFHWWWAEDVASLLFLFWLVGETREALEEAREGREDEDDDD
jgi:divalent metal cation (Fe/Co/Zn/Cd) transporter